MRFAGLLIALSLPVFTQTKTEPDDRPKFDIAAIRANKSGGRGVQLSDGKDDGGRFTATNVTLKQLIALAYHFQPQEITGGPAWLATERFDIEAKPEEGFVPTQEQTQEMLQTLLEERFQLKVQHQSKDGPIYALVVPKGGPKIKLSADQTPVPEQPRRGRGGANGDGAAGPRGGFRAGGAPGGAGPQTGGRGGFRGGGTGAPGAAAGAGNPVSQGTPAAGTAGQPAQGSQPPNATIRQRQLTRPLPRGGMMAGPGLLRGSAIKLEALTRPLTNQLGRPVVDRTNLPGLYDVELTWTPDQLGGGSNNPFPRTESGPSIFTAIHEQLGLKLESATGPIDSLVIEKVEQPTDN